MSELTDLFTNGFKQLNKKFPKRYGQIYNQFLGVDMDHPNNVLGIETTDVDFPNFNDLSKSTQKILLSHEIKIGVYIHEPYFYTNDAGDNDGFEYTLAEEVFKQVSEEYEADMKGEPLNIIWESVPVYFDDEPSGSENTVIMEALSDSNCLGVKYDMAFTGVFAFVDAHENIKYDLHYAEPTGVFYISALYTGKGDFIKLRVPGGIASLENIGVYFAAYSHNNNETIIIIHSSGTLQRNSAKLLAEAINGPHDAYPDSCACTQEICEVESIEPSITNKDSHIYVGDLIQIQRMVKENADCYDLNVNILLDGCDREGCHAHSEDISDSDCETNPFRAYSPFTLPD